MSESDGLWKLESFPDSIGSPDVAVEGAYAAWKDRCRINPERDAAPIDAGGERWSAIVSTGPPGETLVCDYEIEPGLWGKPGRVIYIDAGFV
jgi:hypothetical protein